MLHSVIIPLLPLYVCGTFIDMTKSGKTFAILGILWKVFLVVIIMHLVCIFLQFCVAGAVSHKSPFKICLLYTSPSPRDKRQSRMPSSA